MSGQRVNSLINGVAADYLTINDRAIHYGDGIFETILCHNNHLFYWLQHYQRLLESANKLQLDCPDEQILLDDIRYLLTINKAKNKPTNKPSDNIVYAIKIIVTRGSSERGYVFEKNISSKARGFAKNTMSNRLVLLSTLDSNYSSLLTKKLSTGELFVCKQQVSINESLAGLKHLNRLENILARNEWSAGAGINMNNGNNIVDGLMLNANQYVIEGCMSNLFAVKDNQLFTPDLSQSGVNGVMRDVIIKLAEKNKIRLSIVNIKLDELLAMDALFISNSLIGMKLINKLISSKFQESSLINRLFKMLLNTRDNYDHVV
jgi:4-amino-4-deoxychorismate lyase